MVTVAPSDAWEYSTVETLFSTIGMRPSDRVYDPFMGSGTTLKVAQTAGLVSVGCDIDALQVLLGRYLVSPPSTMELDSLRQALDQGWHDDHVSHGGVAGIQSEREV